MNDMPRESSLDLKYSIKLFTKNIKPFLKVQLFSFLLTFLMFFIVLGIGFVYRAITGTSLRDEPLRYLGGAFIGVFSGFIWIFMTTANGLAVDIIDSGDEFTEFRNSFTYLSKYWWKYAIIALVVYGLPNLIQGTMNLPRIQGALWETSWERVLIFESVGLVISYLVYSLFMLTFPSVSTQGNLKHAFIENFRILKKNWKRVFGTWGLFFLIFHVPTYVFATLALALHIPPFGILWAIMMLLNLFIGTPLSYIVGAGMYFNVDFERFKPID